MGFELRDYQQKLVQKLRDALRAGKKRIIAQSPTGSGKGSVLAAMVRTCTEKGRPCLVMTPRRELVEDLSGRIDSLGVEHGIILAGDRRKYPDRLCQVASVQTLARREKPIADLVIVDECHHATSESWSKILACYPDAAIIGFTATPCRMSGKGLGTMFDAIVEGPTPAELTRQGYLVPVTGFAYTTPDLSRVNKKAGDYNEAELGVVMGGSKIVGDIVEQYQRHAAGLRAIVFCVNVEHSERLAAEFRSKGIAAEHIDGTADKASRQAVFDRYRAGSTLVLCNVMLATEGFDLPEIACVILARPTMSLALAIQMIGRGRRPMRCECGRFPHWQKERCECGRTIAKRELRLHDHAGIVMAHGLPDEAREWTLERGVSSAKKGQSVRTCEECFALYDPTKNEACPRCGHVNKPKKVKIKEEKGVAVPLDQIAKRPPPRGRAFEAYKAFVEEGKRKGWKPMAAKMRFKARFRFFPSKSWDEAIEAASKAVVSTGAIHE
jgi:DNA repair protein RadD